MSLAEKLIEEYLDEATLRTGYEKEWPRWHAGLKTLMPIFRRENYGYSGKQTSSGDFLFVSRSHPDAPLEILAKPFGSEDFDPVESDGWPAVYMSVHNRFVAEPMMKLGYIERKTSKAFATMLSPPKNRGK